MWPKIGEYIENGITVRVFKPGYAEARPSVYWTPESQSRQSWQKPLPPKRFSGFNEAKTPELRF